jgi:hypothetical protein
MGNTYYSEKVRDRRYSKKFQLDRDDLDRVRLVFTLSGGKEKQSQAFEINTQTRTVQDVVITRL